MTAKYTPFVKKLYHLRRIGKRFISSFSNIDISYYCDKNNLIEIENNILSRKGVGDIKNVLKIYETLNSLNIEDNSYRKLEQELHQELLKLPNKTHKSVLTYQGIPKILQTVNEKKNFGTYKPLDFAEIARRLNLMRTEKLGYTCGHKSYYFLESLAELEEALIKYTVTKLAKENFCFVSVPDILSSEDLRSCGMVIENDHNQIYSLDADAHGKDKFLSGTAEMAIGALLRDTQFNIKQLPAKFAAVSRCFRAETSNLLEESGLYRVHQFTKVEMFGVTTEDQSEDFMEYLVQLQEKLFAPLDIHMQILDMPSQELGAPAFRKYDIEAWMPGRNTFGEISSCSNCTDYQSRRLNVQYTDGKTKKYAHTLNGTACAIPRTLIAIVETHQDPKGKVLIPAVLQKYMNGKKYITKNTAVPQLKILKTKK